MRSFVVVLLLGALARAQSREQYVDQLEKAIEHGQIAAVKDRISVEMIANVPEWARRICAAAVNCDLRDALRSREDLLAAADRVRQVGVRRAEDSPSSADALNAAADGTYFRLRVLRACGEETSTQEWLDLADALVKLHGLSADAKLLERAVRYLREGQRAKGTEADPLKAREDELCREGTKRYPDNGFFRSNEQRAELEKIVKLLDAGGHKEAKPLMQALLDDAKDDTIYNDAVNVALEHYRKLRIKARFRSEERKFHRYFVGEFPKGDRWKMQGDTIRQYGRDGKRVRSFSFDYFKLNTWYTIGDTKYDGSNVKGMALITERDVLSLIVKVERRSRIIKKRLNRKISGVQYFVIGGYTKDAEFTRFHTYLWKGKERPWRTYRLWIIELEDYEDLDPAAEFVVDSLRETEYEEK